MRIYGIDFTCAPSRRKPITCAQARLDGATLTLEILWNIRSLSDLEASLRTPGPWVAGFDFPFGQPRKLIENLKWPRSWAGYVAQAGALSRVEWERTLDEYCKDRPLGDRHHLRQSDRQAGARSPMMVVRVPVAKMFHAGAPLLLGSGISVHPCAPSADGRIALEAYPKLVARKWLGSRSYKADERSKQTPDRESARRELLRGLLSPTLSDAYGLRLAIGSGLAEALVRDPTGDRIDALLCAVQAAWAYARRERNWGIPERCDPNEGWIVDPELHTTRTTSVGYNGASYGPRKPNRKDRPDHL